MIQSLSKDLRRSCQPVAKNAAEFAAEWSSRNRDAPFEQRLAQHLSQVTGFAIKMTDFDSARLPEDLVTKVWVCDDEGKELGFGSDVAELKLRLGSLMTRRFEQSANDEWESNGLTEWPDFEVPEQAETPMGVAFPALVDEGSSIGTRAFSRAVDAEQSHRSGTVRLLMMKQPDQVSYIRRKLPLGLMAKVELQRMDGAEEDLIRLAAEGALGAGRIGTDEEFEKQAEDARAGWWTSAVQLGNAIDAAIELLQPVRESVHQMRADRHLGEVAEDVHEELAWLFRPRFAWRSGFSRVLDYGRHLKAIQSRIGRIKSLPLAKDLEKMDRVREHWEPWYAAWVAQPDDPGLWKFGWLLEEYRISLFAPDIPVKTKVSEKLLRSGW